MVGVVTGMVNRVWSVGGVIGLVNGGVVSRGCFWADQWVWSVRWWSVGQLCLSLFIPALMRMDPQPLGGC